MCSAEFVLTALNKQLFWDQTNISPLFIEEKKKSSHTFGSFSTAF